MTTPQNLYAIASGYNVAQGSLIQLTTVFASGDVLPFFAPQCRGNFDIGKRDVRTDGTDFYRGYQNTSWFWPVMTWNQYYYLYNTILGGAYNGEVTIYTRLGFDSYVRMNAIMRLPKQIETDGKYAAPKKVKVDFTRLAAAS